MKKSGRTGELILYTTEDGAVAIKLRVADGTVWLTQLELAELFQTSKQNVSLHVRNVLAEGELQAEATVKEDLTVQTEGARQVRRATMFYNLDMILAVGYRVRSPRGTQFRQWATTQLREYLVKGFVMDDARLKEPGGWDYFDELLARIREIRASEMYLDFAEDQTRRRKAVTMREWEDKLDTFLSFNERELLTHAGKVRAEVAEKLAQERFIAFDAQRKALERLQADAEDMKAVESLRRRLSGKKKGTKKP